MKILRKDLADWANERLSVPVEKNRKLWRTTSDLYIDYLRWAAGRIEHDPMSRALFGGYLARLEGIDVRRRNDGMIAIGVVMPHALYGSVKTIPFTASLRPSEKTHSR